MENLGTGAKYFLMPNVVFLHHYKDNYAIYNYVAGTKQNWSLVFVKTELPTSTSLTQPNEQNVLISINRTIFHSILVKNINFACLSPTDDNIVLTSCIILHITKHTSNEKNSF